ncbi:hypothetical protein AUK10_04375 [Candidatus Gracilibacteria bacterium CG2_30_37_12]|nr:MAG: hypothetical protein AUK10_04375 [Candidatus Gracilibacteria bacterium CG2_30_37_12]
MGGIEVERIDFREIFIQCPVSRCKFRSETPTKGGSKMCKSQQVEGWEIPKPLNQEEESKKKQGFHTSQFCWTIDVRTHHPVQHWIPYRH